MSANQEPTPNPTLERTSTGWPLRGDCPSLPLRGQPVASAQLHVGRLQAKLAANRALARRPLRPEQPCEPIADEPKLEYPRVVCSGWLRSATRTKVTHLQKRLSARTNITQVSAGAGCPSRPLAGSEPSGQLGRS